MAMKEILAKWVWRYVTAMGIVLCGKDSPSPPPAPDYVGAANATAAGNLDAARAAASANKVNQVTPNGNLTYSINGKDSYGNDLYTATQTLSPAQQGIQDQTNQLNLGLMNTANTGLNYANNVLSHPGVDTSQLPQTGMNPGQTYQDAIMARQQPNINQQRGSLTQQLANQGIGQGTQAWDNAWRDQNQRENDLSNSAVINGFNTGLAANQQGFQQQAYNQMQPINVINALRTGSQVQNPQFAQVPQQATTSGPDLTSAAMATGNYNNNVYNQQMASQNSAKGALGGLGGAGLNAAATYYRPSDRRLKKNIKLISTHPSGLPFYSYDYIWEEPSFGVMADEAELVYPDAVVMNDQGYKMVNYARLGT